MQYVVNLPAELGQRLEEQADASGQDVADIICAAVDKFVSSEFHTSGKWTEELEIRRRQLIDRDIQGVLNPDERSELLRLDHIANEHFDRVASPPMDGLHQLHARLLSQSGQR